MTGEAFKQIRHPAVEIHSTRLEGCQAVADEVGDLIKRGAVLGLATGSTPLPLYGEWRRRHETEQLSFARVTTFNLDEYEGLGPDHPLSYRHFMDATLFAGVDLDLTRTHLPPGLYPVEEAEQVSAEYERAIHEEGGIDWQLLGIGRSGHIGFNEPGSLMDSRTRRVRLAEETREDAARDFGGLERVPTHALTMGVGTILGARRIVLLAWGRQKAELVRRALTGPVGPEFPASYLQHHGNLRVVLAETGDPGV